MENLELPKEMLTNGREKELELAKEMFPNGSEKETMLNKRDGWLNVCGVATHVRTWGRWVTEKPEGGPEKCLVLMVSGNPGVTQYYDTFLQSIHQQLNVPVWIISHAGHERPPKDQCLSIMPDGKNGLYDVGAQVAHKAEFIKQYVPAGTDIYLIAHSFGAKVTVDLLKQEMLRKQIAKCYLLFPTLEKIQETPNGKFIGVVLTYFLSITIFMSWVFTRFPLNVRYWLIKMYFNIRRQPNVDTNIINGTVDLIQPKVLRNVFHLVSDELDKIRELDKEVMEGCREKFKIYFGDADGWAPVEHHEDLKRTIPDIDSTVLDSKYQHCFVLETAEDVASILSSEISQEIKFKA